MATLLVEGHVVAAVEVARTRVQRRRGLLGRTTLDGAMLLAPCRSVHTVGMKFAIDVAHLRRCGSDTFVVRRVTTMAPQRLGRPVARADAVLEASAGSFARWGLGVESRIEVRP